MNALTSNQGTDSIVLRSKISAQIYSYTYHVVEVN
jgi:hypothetical protein